MIIEKRKKKRIWEINNYAIKHLYDERKKPTIRKHMEGPELIMSEVRLAMLNRNEAAGLRWVVMEMLC